MDFQGVSDAAAGAGETDRTRTRRAVQIAPVGLPRKGIKTTQCLIGPRQELGVYR